MLKIKIYFRLCWHACFDDYVKIPKNLSKPYLAKTKSEYFMTYVVVEDCIKCKHTDCVDVCPVDCFHEGPNFLVIDPEECIDCTLCEPECPIGAIFADDDVPEGQEHFTELNAELSLEWPVINISKESPPDATEWEGKPDKLKLLER